MFSGRLTDRLYSCWLVLSSRALVMPLCCGTLIGILSVSLSLSWTLTWSDDRALASAAILMFACGLTMGTRAPLSRYLSQSELAITACTWTLLQPWLNPLTEGILPYVPGSMLSSEIPRLAVGLAFALPTWFVAGWLLSSLVVGLSPLRSTRGWTPAPASASAGLSAGVVCGLMANAFVMAPWIGAWSTVALAVAVALAAKFAPTVMARAAATAGTTATVNTAMANTATDAMRGDAESGSSRNGATNPVAANVRDADAAVITILRSFAAIAVGGLIAVILRLMAQLMPNSVQVNFAGWMGLAIGLGIGQCLAAKQSHSRVRSAVFWIVPACSAAVLLALMPFVVSISLRATTAFTLVFFQMTFRVLLLIVATVPLGFALAGLLPGEARRSASHDRGPMNHETSGWWLMPLPVAGGFVAAQFGFESLGLVTLMALCSMTLVGLSLCTLLATGHGRPSRMGTVGIACCSIVGLMVPLWRANDNPAQTAKLLFSTPSFMAHRAGWESRLLPVLDDARALDVREGVRGPLTVWRSHGMELHLRECGIPRSIITANESHPQFAPEVLQAVFPLVMSQHPNQILLLGASCGVPLSTCLKFPVQDVVCVENDKPLMQVIRGPIAKETGYDPFLDERVQLVTIPPVIAVMARPETYDVILSSPPSSSIVAGAAMFTVDHYRHVARRLAAEGIFCQRFQCVDYGTDPLRIVVQSMRQAFVEVIAIETAAGEFLLLGTNTAGTFVAGDLPSRLQAPHVRRLLAQSGLDWSSLLNYPAYDDAALGEICAEGRAWTNAPANGILALRAPLELLRWGAKLKELNQVLSARRSTPAPHLNGELESNVVQGGVQLTRKSRLLEWVADRHVSPELLRRLSEVVAQQNLVRENPDAEFHAWGYRTALREQLQIRRPSAIQTVSHSMTSEAMHPEDQRRQAYFVALGQAATQPTAERIEAVAAFLQPYDPLMSYFARQEIADLQARGKIDPASELAHRLHSIYFSPVADGSTRNIATTLELLVQHPEVIPDPVQRFDMLNGLIQTLRTHWESRLTYPVKSARRRLADVDRSMVAVEKAITAMETAHADSQLLKEDWQNRKRVIDRLLIRPLHTYREHLQATAATSESRTRAMFDAETIPAKQ